MSGIAPLSVTENGLMLVVVVVVNQSLQTPQGYLSAIRHPQVCCKGGGGHNGVVGVGIEWGQACQQKRSQLPRYCVHSVVQSAIYVLG